MTCFQPEDLPWFAVPALPAPKRFGADWVTGFAPSPSGAESRGSSSASAELDGLKSGGVSPPAPRLGWGPAAQKTGAPIACIPSHQKTPLVQP